MVNYNSISGFCSKFRQENIKPGFWVKYGFLMDFDVHERWSYWLGRQKSPIWRIWKFVFKSRFSRLKNHLRSLSMILQLCKSWCYYIFLEVELYTKWWRSSLLLRNTRSIVFHPDTQHKIVSTKLTLVSRASVDNSFFLLHILLMLRVFLMLPELDCLRIIVAKSSNFWVRRKLDLTDMCIYFCRREERNVCLPTFLPLYFPFFLSEIYFPFPLQEKLSLPSASHSFRVDYFANDDDLFYINFRFIRLFAHAECLILFRLSKRYLSSFFYHFVRFSLNS